MGLLSSLAAPQAPQFQSLTVKPVARVTAALMTASPDQGPSVQTTAPRLGGAELPAEMALHPVLAAGSGEAIFRGLLPVPPAVVQGTKATEAKGGQIETLTEVDGISLDGIPYLRDGAVLLDDLPQAEPAPAPKAKSAETVAVAFATPAALHPETEAQVEPEQVLSDQAERAYQDAREISAVRAEPAPGTDKPLPDQADVDQAYVDQADGDRAEPAIAQSVDKRA